MQTHTRVASILIALVVANPLNADAKPKPKGKGKSVKVHMERAAKAHKSGKFDVALTELQAAHAIDPQPKLLFAIAQVHAKLDNCPEAVANYKKFLATTKDKKKQEVVKQAIEACKEIDPFAEAKPADKPDSSVFRAKKPADEAAAKPEPPPTPTPVVEPTPIVEPTPTPPPQPIVDTEPSPVAPIAIRPDTGPKRTPWYRDRIGDALVITGVGATIVSFFMVRAMNDDLDAAEASTQLDAYEDLVDSARSKRMYTVIFAGAGLTLVAAGVLRYALRSDGSERRVAVVPTADGGLITWSGGF